MKKFVVFLFTMFICVNSGADTVSVNWLVDGTTYDTTTCSVGNDLTLPTNPTKYGHTFVGWRKPTYLKLEYIESTGTQYIETPYIPPFRTGSQTIHTTVSFEKTNTNLSGWQPLMTINRDDYRYEIVFVDARDEISVLFGYPNVFFDTGLKTGQNKIEIISKNQSYTVKTNDIILGADACRNEPVMTNRLVLLKNSWYKLYDFSISVDDVLMENLIPVKRTSDNVVGLYDTVSGVFLENAGTDDLIAGPIIGVFK